MEQTETNGDWFSEDAATFGDRLAAAREAVNMSQSDLARRLGIKLKTLRGWEEDLSEPRANKLQMVSGVLNVSMRWLLTGEGEGVEEPGLENGEAPEVRDLLLEIRDIKMQMNRSADQLGRLEKRLRKRLEG
ncbi:helix-turn-helix domain-containing protein [Aliiroseovarius sp. S1123]|jgi:transcriptional regulator with XRE-family HTH domain|uniref:helix-turn-helix domain-containing protein n=1 Tax=unclassified Aliiroseovarius TaxID=2623558 RepID=UPI001FF5890C|nr:helix-turn-helix transcriptional regulator [Aliiroseovarius sp. S1123]MCK0170728.1 helix-turn-helix domain-containing protein [Aliiroseovarius sp. S1123]